MVIVLCRTNRQTDKQTNRQTDKQTNRQTDKQWFVAITCNGAWINAWRRSGKNISFISTYVAFCLHDCMKVDDINKRTISDSEVVQNKTYTISADMSAKAFSPPPPGPRP